MLHRTNKPADCTCISGTSIYIGAFYQHSPIQDADIIASTPQVRRGPKESLSPFKVQPSSSLAIKDYKPKIANRRHTSVSSMMLETQ